ncbi:peptidoglycan-binding protein LysM [Scandinavium goeteborgense]|uniref:Potassium binding protein Kbp n=1 Tax=Scandinavium goeteborgense TaxID=1851514 RepID=A0A4R6DP78_SCAGO|nr:peptidoglycan-binding protein LysM [Scandinavium goeteborgense]TDN46750.1 LysM domain-containing protein [Scandinavium goeteborgense]
MAFFDFIKHAGEKIWSTTDASTADKITKLKEHISAPGFSGTENIVVAINDDESVTLSGTVPDQETKNKIIVMVGNVEGISGVNDNLKPGQTGQESHFYTVVKGDTLSVIARNVYADSGKYKLIFEANKPMLLNPDKIYPGQKLIIPALKGE